MCLALPNHSFTETKTVVKSLPAMISAGTELCKAGYRDVDLHFFRTNTRKFFFFSTIECDAIQKTFKLK